MIAGAAEAWLSALEQDPARGQRFAAAVEAAGLSKVPTFARPLFLSAAQQSAAERACGEVHRALEGLLREWREGGPLRAQIKLHPDVERAALDDPRGLGATRYDAVVDEAGGVQILECQAGDPSAMGWHDAFADALDLIGPKPVHPERRETRAERVAPPYQPDAWRPGKLVDALEAMLSRERGRRIAFLCARESFVLSDHRLLAAGFRARGWDAEVVDPRDWDAARFDVVFRDTVDELVLEPYRHGGLRLLADWRAGKVRVMNPFSAVVADDKSLFARLGHLACVPETRMLTAGMRPERTGWVLKPADGYGGFGVVVGPDCSDEQWQHALDAALATGRLHVVQRYVPLPEVEWPGRRKLKVVLSFWWHDGLTGAFARAAPASVINVHQGGGLVPVYFPAEAT